MNRPLSRPPSGLLPWTRIAIHALVLGCALVPAVGCFSPSTVEIRFTRQLDLNPKIRTDRLALSDGQLRAAAYTGPYRDGLDLANCIEVGGCEVIAPVTPALVDSERLEKLLQSNCLWVADPPAPTTDVETVRVNWEFVAEVQREGMHLACNSPTRFGLCRLRNPETGQPISFQPLDEDFQACPGTEPPMVDRMTLDFGGGLDQLPLSTSTDGGPLVVENDLFVATAPLVAEYVGRGPADPYRRCPGTATTPVQIAGGGAVAATLYGGLGCGTGGSGSSAAVSACAVGCAAMAPAGDNALRLRDTSTGVTRWLQPNLMTVTGTASIGRAMAPASGNGALRTWRTSVSPNGDRWHENFSPNLEIVSVRIFVPGPNDTISTDDFAPSIAPAPNLTVRGSYRKTETVKTFTFNCPGMRTTTGYEYVLGPGHACTGEQTDVIEVGLTPTYMRQHLTVASFPLADPLQWEVLLDNANAPAVMIEFRLRAYDRANGLLVSPPAVDLGDLVIGDSESGWLELQNVGATPMRVTAASLGGPNPPDFRFRLVGAPAPVPLPVAVTMTPAKRVVRVLEIGSKSLVTDRVAAPTVGPQHLRLVRPDRDGQSLVAYGNQLDYMGDIAFHRDGPALVPYIFPPGSVPLDVLEAYTAATLPLVLAPAQVLRIAVVAQPGAYGPRRAELRLEGYPLNNPSERHVVIAALVAEGDTGALPNLWPQSSNWGTVGAAGAERNLLLVNDGDRDLQRLRISFATGSRFTLVPGNAANQVVPSGASEMYTIRYTPRCRSSRAPDLDTLLIETSAGTQQAQLRATPGC